MHKEIITYYVCDICNKKFKVYENAEKHEDLCFLTKEANKMWNDGCTLLEIINLMRYDSSLLPEFILNMTKFTQREIFKKYNITKYSFITKFYERLFVTDYPLSYERYCYILNNRLEQQSNK